MRVGIKSIDFDGKTYPVGSEVSYTDVQNVKVQPSGGSASRVIAGGAVLAGRSVRYDQCVPTGGQIIAHLTQPLRVKLGE